MKQSLRAPLMAAAMFCLGTVAHADCANHLSAGTDLWQEPNDALAAILEPDCYAWQLFVSLNWPGDPTTQAADPDAALGDDGPAAWEFWRNARTGSYGEVFDIGGRDPGPWLLQGAALIARNAADVDPEPLQQMAFFAGLPLPEIDEDFPIAANETRMNKATYEFVRNNGLYSLEGLQAAFDPTSGVMHFPGNAKEIKARWREISGPDKARYHWATITTAGVQKTYGLTALHITTKDLPNWFWATFEHIDNRESQVNGGIRGHEGWIDPSVDRYTCPSAPIDCDAAPAMLAGTKWQNYVLRGTQVDFTDGRGRPTVLANSVIERGFQKTSSCITCHARAAYDSTGRMNDIFLPTAVRTGPLGSPDPDWFFVGGATTRMQTDFVWSFMRACSTATTNKC